MWPDDDYCNFNFFRPNKNRLVDYLLLLFNARLTNQPEIRLNGLLDSGTLLLPRILLWNIMQKFSMDGNHCRNGELS